MQWSGVEWPGVPILGEEQDLCTHTTPIHTRQTVGHQLLRLLDRVVLTYSGTGSQPGGVDALLNHFARNDEGTIRSVLPGEHAPADRNRLGSVNAANVPNFDRDDGLRRLCAIPTGGARYRQTDERDRNQNFEIHRLPLCICSPGWKRLSRGRRRLAGT